MAVLLPMPQSPLGQSRTVLLAGTLLGVFVAAPAAAEGPPVEAPVAPGPSVYTESGLLGSVRLGPTIGVGAPDGVRFGVLAKWRGLLAAGGAFSVLPPMTVPGSDAQVVRASGEIFARVHPFQGAFFVGLAGGYAQTKGTMAQVRMAFRQVQNVETHAYASAFFIAPHAGFQWMIRPGMTVGCDAGLEIPIGASSPSFDAAKYGLVMPIEGKGSAADTTNAIATSPIPVVRLIELGYVL